MSDKNKDKKPKKEAENRFVLSDTTGITIDGLSIDDYNARCKAKKEEQDVKGKTKKP